MALWIPLLKASLPYVTQIVATAIPAFTSASTSSSGKVDDVTTQQIAELQSAVTQNAESIHILAEKLQQTIQGIEVASLELQRKIIFFKRLAYSAIGMAGLSLMLAIWALAF